MENHYKILGVTSAATPSELRRAYRILARRYHPDLNPGESNADTFKKIARAYAVLSDPEQRAQHDSELEKNRENLSSAFDRAHQEYRKNQRAHAETTTKQSRPTQPPPQREAPRSKTAHQGAKKNSQDKGDFTLSKLTTSSRKTIESLRKRFFKKGKTPSPQGNQISQLSLLEISVSIYDAIQGTRRTVELSGKDGAVRKISALIPAGVRSGSIVRFRAKDSPSEEVILVIRVAHHPWLSMSNRGLVMDIPITIGEAVMGGKIQVPSLGDPLLVTVEPGTQSGQEVRVKGKGVFLNDGSRGDLFIRFMIRAPESPNAVGLGEKCGELTGYYSHPVRQHLPRSILDE